MTYLPKSELVGVLSPSSINTKDVGKNWYDIGAIVNANFITYLGNGIAIAGNGIGRIYRSTDYGTKWTDTGAISAGFLWSAAYLGNGIVLVGDSQGHIFRHTNFADNGTSVSPQNTWVDQGVIAAGQDIWGMSYLGNGVVIFGTAPAKDVYRHTDFGDTTISAWSQQVGVTLGTPYRSVNLENGIVLIGDTGGRIYRSTDYGLNWSLTIVTASIQSFLYLGNGIVIAGSGNTIIRSIDFGLTWTQIIVLATFAYDMIYLGNGVVVIGDAGHIFRSENYGLTFTDLGAITPNTLTYASYLDNGVAIFSDSTGEFFRSDVGYKTNEGQTNFTRISADVTALRGLYTVPTPNVYTNLDWTRSLMIRVYVSCSGGVAGGNAYILARADTAVPPSTPVSGFVGLVPGLVNEQQFVELTAVIPPRHDYRVESTTSETGFVILSRWFEMYI